MKGDHVRKSNLSVLMAILAIATLAISACALPLPVNVPAEGISTFVATETPTPEGYTGAVTEIAIRRLNEGQDLEAFAAAREAFVAALTAEPGVGVDREFAAILDGSTFAPPTATIFTGMTQYENLDAFAAAGQRLGQGAEAAAFFSTFEPLLFTALRPKHAENSYDLAQIMPEAGQILQVAARDLSMYENFDSEDYETRLSAFLDALSQQPGFVAEYQWVSVLDPNIVVGMTVYESVDAFAAIAQDAEFVGQMMPFISDYPPFTGYIHVDARR